MCYCKDNYSVNVSVFGLVEKELSFKKNGPKKRIGFFVRYKLGTFGRVYKSLLSVNSVKLVKPSDFTRNRVYLRVNTILVPKNVNSVNSESWHLICGTLLMLVYFCGFGSRASWIEDKLIGLRKLIALGGTWVRTLIFLMCEFCW